MNTSKLGSTLALIMFITASILPSSMMAAASDQSAPKVGIYDTRAVALAYGRSDEGLQRFRTLHEEHDAAEAAGDTATVRKLDIKGPWLQERMHMQVFGNLPIDDILDGREAMLAEVAREAGVVMIVASPVLHNSMGAEHAIAHDHPEWTDDPRRHNSIMSSFYSDL